MMATTNHRIVGGLPEQSSTQIAHEIDEQRDHGAAPAANAFARAVQILDNANSMSLSGTFEPKLDGSLSIAAAIVGLLLMTCAAMFFGLSPPRMTRPAYSTRTAW